MIIYHPVTRDRTTHVICQPGNEHPVSDFFDKDGKPSVFVVEFKYGRAEVPDNLGRYLIDEGLAQESAILLVA
nr:hypothetical protein [Chromobacterium sp. ASV5]